MSHRHSEKSRRMITNIYQKLTCHVRTKTMGAVAWQFVVGFFFDLTKDERKLFRLSNILYSDIGLVYPAKILQCCM